MDRTRTLVAVRAAVTVGSGLAALTAVAVSAGPPVQPALVLWFVLACPGAACVGLARPPAPLFTVALSLAVSCALAVVVAQSLLYAGAWSPGAGLAILVALTVLAAVTDLVRAARDVRAGASEPSPAR